MKTIGEILTFARREQGLSAQDISRITKIELKYIKALEKDDFDSLPSATFIKGFIRNYARVINRNPDEMIAVFRRDFSHKTKAPKTTITPLSLPTFHFEFHKGTILIFSLGFLMFISYLAFQYRAILVPPPLEVQNPKPKAVVTSPVLIEGVTSPDSIVTINGTLDTRPDQTGKFSATFNLSAGDQELSIEAVNRFSRRQTEKFTITVISN
jgi:cytoskeletal protein RodZ